MLTYSCSLFAVVAFCRTGTPPFRHAKDALFASEHVLMLAGRAADSPSTITADLSSFQIMCLYQQQPNTERGRNRCDDTELMSSPIRKEERWSENAPVRCPERRTWPPRTTASTCRIRRQRCRSRSPRGWYLSTRSG